MKLNIILIAVSSFFITSCKKDSAEQLKIVNERFPTSQTKNRDSLSLGNDLGYKFSGTYQPSASELLNIQANLEKLSKLNLTEQNKLIATFTPSKINQASSDKFKSDQSSNQVNAVDDEANYGEYLAMYSTTANDFSWPDESDLIMNNLTGSLFRYKWTIAYNTFGFFKIQSMERCELLFYGYNYPPEQRHGINTVTHEGSTILGLTGPISWTEMGNFNYFTPGNYNAYFNTIGVLTVAGTGTREVTGSRYANSLAIAGNNPN